MTVVNLTIFSFKICSAVTYTPTYFTPDFSLSKVFKADDPEINRFKNYSNILIKIAPTIAFENHHFQTNSYSSNMAYYAYDNYY